MSTTPQPHPVLNSEQECSSPMADVQAQPNSQSTEDEALYMYAKYLIKRQSILIVRTLFEHTKRQYARACNRILRQGQHQQDAPEKPQVNGVHWKYFVKSESIVHWSIR